MIYDRIIFIRLTQSFIIWLLHLIYISKNMTFWNYKNISGLVGGNKLIKDFNLKSFFMLYTMSGKSFVNKKELCSAVGCLKQRCCGSFVMGDHQLVYCTELRHGLSFQCMKYKFSNWNRLLIFLNENKIYRGASLYDL